jgi:branched-chain amino acid transport system substrate-binding protein
VKAQWTLIVGGVAALMLAGGCQATAAEVEKVVIGADLELTGPNASIGKVYAQALQLKVEQANQDGLLGSRQLSLVLRDNRSDAATSVANITALAADPEVKALVTGVCAECVVAAAKAINTAKIPTVALALPANVGAPVSDRKYIFKLAPNTGDDATVLVSELEQTGLHKVAVVGSDDQFGKDAIEGLTSKLNRANLPIVATERIVADPEKLAAAADRVAKSKADVMVVQAFSPLSEQLAKAARDAGYTGRILFGSSAANNLFLSGDTAAAMDGANLVFTPTLVSDDIVATSPAKASRVAWFRDFLSKYGTYGAYASFAADAVELVSQAIIQTNSTDRDKLRSAIETTRMDGLSGPIRLTPDNHSALMPQAVTLLVAANGRWRLAS